jgi:hypothetical protein
MGNTTAFAKLADIMPESETHWREILAQTYRLRGFPGDESWARTQEIVVSEIRSGTVIGSSRTPRLCPRCLARGARYHLLYIAGTDRCGTCHWPE